MIPGGGILHHSGAGHIIRDNLTSEDSLLTMNGDSTTTRISRVVFLCLSLPLPHHSYSWPGPVKAAPRSSIRSTSQFARKDPDHPAGTGSRMPKDEQS